MSAASPMPTPADGRAQARQRCLFRGRLEFDDRKLTIDCTIRNLAANGARLVFGGATAYPKDFDLVIEGMNLRRRARLVWSTGFEAGVMFV